MTPGSPLDKARELRSYPARARAALLRARGESLTSIASYLGVDRSYVAHVNAGRRISPKLRVERAIARALGLKLKEAFPERDFDKRVA